MKKLLLTIAVVLGLSTTLSAQSPGNIWVGGSVGFNTSKTKNADRLTNYNVIPEIGYVVSDSWGVGVKLGYAHDEVVRNNHKNKVDGFGVNPFARYTFAKGDIGGLFVDGGVGYTYSKTKGSDIKNHEIEVGFRPGVAFNVTDNIALTGKFGFLGYQYDKLGELKTNSFGFDFDLSQIMLGMNIVF